MHGRVGLDQALPLPHQLPHQHHLTLLVLGNQLHGYRQALRGNQHSQPLPMYQRLNSRSPPSRTTNASTVARKNIQLPISPWQVVQPQHLLRLRHYHFRTSSYQLPRHQHQHRLNTKVASCLLNRHMIDGHRTHLVPVAMNNHIAHLLHILAPPTSLPGEHNKFNNNPSPIPKIS